MASGARQGWQEPARVASLPTALEAPAGSDQQVLAREVRSSGLESA